MSSRSVVLVPADRATNVELVTQVATALAAPGAADIHILNVMPRAQSWHALEDWRGRPWVLAGNQSVRTETATLSVKNGGTIRDVRLRGKDETHHSGVRATYRSACHRRGPPLRHDSSMAEHRSRGPYEPFVACTRPCIAIRGTRSRTMGAWQHQRGRRRGRYDARVRGRAANRRRSRGSTRRAPDDASCARELSRAFRFQRQRGMARRTATGRPTKADRETA